MMTQNKRLGLAKIEDEGCEEPSAMKKMDVLPVLNGRMLLKLVNSRIDNFLGSRHDKTQFSP